MVPYREAPRSGGGKPPGDAGDAVSATVNKWSKLKPHVKSLVVSLNPHAFKPTALQAVQAASAAASSSSAQAVNSVLKDLNFEQSKPVSAGASTDAASVCGSEAAASNEVAADAIVQRAKHFSRLLRDESLMLKVTAFAEENKLGEMWGWQLTDRFQQFCRKAMVFDKVPKAFFSSLWDLLMDTIDPDWFAFASFSSEFVLSEGARQGL